MAKLFSNGQSQLWRCGLTPDQLLSIETAGAENASAAAEDCNKRLNTCGRSLTDLLYAHPIYNYRSGLYKVDVRVGEEPPAWLAEEPRASYEAGEQVIFITNEGKTFELYRALELVETYTAVPDHPDKWEKVCSITVVSKDREFLLSAQEIRQQTQYLEFNLTPDLEQGDIVWVEGKCGDTVCLFEATQDVPAPAGATQEFFDEYSNFSRGEYWKKIYCVDTGANKCLGPQRKKPLELGYELVKIGSKEDYVEVPVSYSLRSKCELSDLAGRSDCEPPVVLTKEQISELSQPPPSDL